MKVAIPVFGARVSPRFDCAVGFLLGEVVDGELKRCEEVSALSWAARDRVKKLVELGVDTLICGGIDRVSATQCSVQGVRVYSWITGDAVDALESLLSGELGSQQA